MTSSPLALPTSPSRIAIPDFLTTVFRPQSSGATDIAGYLEPQRPAETAIRALVNAPNGGSLSGATAEQRLDRDLVNLSDRADKVLALYGNDARLAQIRRDLANQVSAKGLANVGKGPTFQEKGPATTTTERVLVNGTSRFTAVDLQSQTINRSQLFDAQGLVGGEQSVQTIRTVTEAGGNDVSTGKALASVSRFEDTVQTVATDVRSGTRQETFAQSAIVTRSDTTDIRAETTLRAVVTRNIENEKGRFIERVVREDFQSVTTLADQTTVTGAQERRSITRTLVNIDTGEVTTSSESSVVSASVQTKTTGEGANAVTTQSITVRADQNTTRSRAGGAEDETVVRETFRSENSNILRTTRGDTTTERVRTAASVVDRTITGNDQTVLKASQGVSSAATAIDSKGNVSASAEQRNTQFRLEKTGALVNDGFDPTAPIAQIPETRVLNASTVASRVTASIAALGAVSATAREESEQTRKTAAGAVLRPVQEATVSVSLPAPSATPAVAAKSEDKGVSNSPAVTTTPPPTIKVTTPKGELEVTPVKNGGGKFEVEAERKNGIGPSILVDPANRTLTADARGNGRGVTSTADGETGLLIARGAGAANSNGPRTARGSITDEGATIQAQSPGKANRRALVLQANDVGELFRATRTDNGFEAVTPLPTRPLNFVASPTLRLSV